MAEQDERWTGEEIFVEEDWRRLAADLRQSKDELRERFEKYRDEARVRIRLAEQRMEELEEALRVAADDLGKAASQFLSIKLSQGAGHNPQIENNPTIFAEKERRARRALTESEELHDK